MEANAFVADSTAVTLSLRLLVHLDRFGCRARLVDILAVEERITHRDFVFLFGGNGARAKKDVKRSEIAESEWPEEPQGHNDGCGARKVSIPVRKTASGHRVARSG